MATVDAEGTPNASYAPFVQIGNKFYVLVSFMAKHTKNLSESRKVSAMFIEDESATKQVYARERLTVEVSTSQIERDSDDWNNIVGKLKERHGKIVDILNEMTDFILVALHPVKGAYVNVSEVHILSIRILRFWNTETISITHRNNNDFKIYQRA